jgi:CMD domain protein
MSAETTDIIDLLAGIAPGSGLDAIRSRRSQARENAQNSYAALFEPADFGDVTAVERHAVAAFVAGVHGEPATREFYAARLATLSPAGTVDSVTGEIERAKAEGPYGAFPVGPLSVEDKDGPTYRVVDESRRALGQRIAAALEHAHLLVFHPRDADPAALQALLDAGWSSNAIVTLSQLVAFLSFQIRTVAGLRTLGASLGRRAKVSAEAG